ncbi:helix-turn-helix domain-containing protein [Mycobacterium malmoense]|uniref:Transcriptional regulator n=1 Tax=Mycobacterium malmoense TaxID=1780 RepID=A0ABX3SR73_MYCMA|nr:helix-turn-helix domain-containing protein [Mycobacterium malmoense]OIN80669.1 transcriptional regulator [Mycobacterium malmoense]ORA81804.1 transcriptional regulator [Mycobacterium malmoense]QZA19434.1 helix-turn-helix domain-containing protein [Mycobacterium malmoense]UNB96187.1 helix-turn-helix transcriptional regulator [Mycobacterium malmoense]
MPRADPTAGDLVRIYREEKNWSQKRLAGQMHKSVSWVSQTERGELPLNDLTVIQRLAAVLGARPQELIEAALGPDAETIRNRPYVEQLRLAIAGHPAPDHIITPVADGPPCDLESLRQRTLHIWERVHASAYRDMGPAIAALISELEHASRTAAKTQRSQLLSLLAQTYQAAAAMLVKVGDRGAGWVAADRAIAAAERTHNPALILAGQLRMARTLLDSSEQALARHVLTQATQRHEAIIAGGDHGLISLVGSSALLLAILHARDANTESAEQCLTVGRRLAAVLGADRNHHDTEFGPTNVAIHAVGVAVELGNGQQALDRAAHVRHPEQLSPERQARYLVDLARAHLLTRSGRDALRALIKAEQIAAEELAESPRVAELIDDIEALNRRPRLPGLRELRQRLYG